MVKINRRTWLIFDIVGMILIIEGIVLYTGVIVKSDDIASEGVFLMGFFFVIFGAILGYDEGISMRREINEISRSINVEKHMASIPDDSEEPYIFDMDSSWNESVEEMGTVILSDTSEEGCSWTEKR